MSLLAQALGVSRTHRPAAPDALMVVGSQFCACSLRSEQSRLSEPTQNLSYFRRFDRRCCDSERLSKVIRHG
jgi:hypothetical protein